MISIDLTGKYALVTGASRGIGAAVALLFARAGAHVYLNSLSQEALQPIADQIEQEQGNCTILPFDVGQADQVKAAFQTIFKQSKKLDILVNNAGVMDDALLPMVSQQQIEQAFQVNTFGTLYCAQYASRLMQRSGGGSIINLSSIIGKEGNVGQAVYSGSKAAVIGITQSLAKELAPHHIRVNAIAPGLIATDMAARIPDEYHEKMMSSIAMGRIGEPDDIAKSALFLASDLSTYVTGQVLGVDGGMVI